MYPIILAPNEKLCQVTSPVDPAMPGLAKIIAEMKRTLLFQADPEGVGLAANQVGLPYRLFLTRFNPKTKEIRVFINPEIVDHSQEFQPDNRKNSPLEGCLSIPKLYGAVKRYSWVKLKYRQFDPVTGLLGHWVTDLFEGFSAVVIQHEMDHLSGHVFTEKLLEQKGKIYRLTGKNKKGKEEWEEVEL